MINLLQHICQAVLRAIGRIHDNDIARWTARIFNPILKERVVVLVVTGNAGIGWGTVHGCPLASQRDSAAQSLIQKVDIVNPALDVPIVVAVLTSKRGSSIQHLVVVAGTVNDDASPLFYHVLGEYPIEIIRELRGLIKRDVVFEKEGFDEVMVDDHRVDRLRQKVRHGTLPRTWSTRHLDELLAWWVHGCEVLILPSEYPEQRDLTCTTSHFGMQPPSCTTVLQISSSGKFPLPVCGLFVCFKRGGDSS